MLSVKLLGFKIQLCFLMCLSKNLGIPNGSRARPLLFSTSTLQKSGGQYPSIGQKKLSGAASRMLIQWATVISDVIFRDHPSNTHRLDGTKVFFFKTSIELE